ncbi:MAG: cytochrome P450 [Pseudomonadota bacterium]
MRTVHLSQSPTEHGFVQNPYAHYGKFRSADAVFWEEYGFWTFARFEDVATIFRDHRFGREILHVATREDVGLPEPTNTMPAFEALEANSLLEREPPVHTRLRALVNRAFVSRRVERSREQLEDLCRSLARNLQPGDDLLENYCTPVPITVITELLGVPSDMAPQLLDWSHKMVAVYQARRDLAVDVAAEQAADAFTRYLRDYVAHRRQAPRKDLLSALITAEEAGDKLTTDELIANVILLLNAGHEATVHALGNGIKTLVQERKHISRGIDPQLVEELLRYDPPLHMFTRYALEDLKWNGLGLRKGEKVGLLIGAANHDPAANPDPARFDPNRHRPRHVSLGGGIHFCVGAPLARLELEVALSVLFDEVGTDLEVDVGPYADTYHFHGLTKLRLAGAP